MGYFILILLSMLPVAELRGGIAVGVLQYDLGLMEAFLLGVGANIFSANLWFLILPRLVFFLEKHSKFVHRLLMIIFKKTHAKHSRKLKIWGEIFLIFFIAIPFPGSGGWTGAILAYLFNIKRKTAMILISTGVFCSGIIVTFLLHEGIDLFMFFKNLS